RSGSTILVTLLALLASGAGPVHGDDWPQWLGPRRGAIWREGGILDKFPAGGPKVRWRAPVALGYAGPAVAGGRVYVTDWLPDRGVKVPNSGFARGELAGKERVHCLDDRTGQVIWTRDYPCTYTITYPGGPRTTPLVHGGKVYTLGAMGDLYCLD